MEPNVISTPMDEMNSSLSNTYRGITTMTLYGYRKYKKEILLRSNFKRITEQNGEDLKR
jgi:hypothetical protein